MHIFLGYYQASMQNLPESMEEPVLALDTKGFSILGAAFSAAMVLLCMLISGLSLRVIQ
jgi:uncharacterized protein with NAD-binding domain and iron-sulfur cluster